MEQKSQGENIAPKTFVREKGLIGIEFPCCFCSLHNHVRFNVPLSNSIWPDSTSTILLQQNHYSPLLWELKSIRLQDETGRNFFIDFKLWFTVLNDRDIKKKSVQCLLEIAEWCALLFDTFPSKSITIKLTAKMYHIFYILHSSYALVGHSYNSVKSTVNFSLLHAIQIGLKAFQWKRNISLYFNKLLRNEHLNILSSCGSHFWIVPWCKHIVCYSLKKKPLTEQ